MALRALDRVGFPATNKTSDSWAKTASLPAREASASFTEKRIEFSSHLPEASSRILTLNTGDRPLKNLAQPRLARHVATYEFRDCSSATLAGQLQSLGNNSSQFLRYVHTLGRQAIFDDVSVAAGKDHDVTGVESYALAADQPCEGSPSVSK